MSTRFNPRSIEDFCQRHGICRSTFYKHRKDMPNTTNIGNRVIILEVDEHAWVEARAGNRAASEAA